MPYNFTHQKETGFLAFAKAFVRAAQTRAVLFSLAAALALFTAGCSSPVDSDGGSFTSTPALDARTAERQTYLGGSLVYNPADPALGNISVGTDISLRYARIPVTDETAETRTVDTDVEYGCATVSAVSAEAITLSYFGFVEPEGSGESVLVFASTLTINAGASGDINKDGKPDLLWQKAPEREGMEGAMWLTLVTAMPGAAEDGYSWMYAILPESEGSGDNGNILGVTSYGRAVFKGYSGSAAARFRGGVYGDIVLDTKTRSYAVLTGRSVTASDFRPLASQAAVDVNDETWVQGTARGGLTEKNKRPARWYTAEQFTGLGTPGVFWGLLPSTLTEGEGITGDTAIDKLNSLLRDTPLETIVDAVVAAAIANEYVPNALVTSVDELRASAAALKKAAGAGGENFVEYEKVAALRNLFYAVYPANCPAPPVRDSEAADKKSKEIDTVELFPVISLYFGDAPSGELLTDEVLTSYGDYAARRDQFVDAFGSAFTEVFDDDETFGLDADALAALKAVFDTQEVTVRLGLYGRYTSYWGKMEGDYGLATLLLVEGKGVKAATVAPVSTPVYLWPAVTITDDPLRLGVSAGDRTSYYGVESNGITTGVGIESTVTSPDLFVGYAGLYGGEVRIGTDYGAAESWGVIQYPDPSCNPFAWGRGVAGSAFYAGSGEGASFAGAPREAAVSELPTTGSVKLTTVLKSDAAACVEELCGAQILVDMTAEATVVFAADDDGGVSVNRSVARDLTIGAESGLVLEYDDYCYKIIFDDKSWILKTEDGIRN